MSSLSRRKSSKKQCTSELPLPLSSLPFYLFSLVLSNLAFLLHVVLQWSIFWYPFGGFSSLDICNVNLSGTHHLNGGVF